MNNERKIKVGNRHIGDNEPVFVIAEIGINHNGSVELLKFAYPKINGISNAILHGAE